MRTMVHNADELLEEHLRKDPALREEWNNTQKLKNDIRVTSVGRILRKISMDELPQLWNVLTGSMSLVGPRPMMPAQQSMYPGRSYYNLRPGITGFWQISDRNDCDFAERATYDTAYAAQVSFATDMNVLWRTVAVVLRGTGY
jgi:lipopolysaccharide/colanic/teichoic acid biosynthesis glycosyltransferase